MRPRSAALAALLTAPLLLPAAAPAAHVSSGEHWFPTDTKPSFGTRVAYAPVDGVANQLSIRMERRRMVLSDPADPLTAGRGCRAVADGAVACRRLGGSVFELEAATGIGDDRVSIVGTSSEASVVLDLGEGADTLVATGVPRLSAVGGPGGDDLRGSDGHDRLYGGDGDDRLDGGEGDDHLAGDAGVDELLGGPADDQLSGDGPFGAPVGPPAPAADDRLDGGPGVDTADYGMRTGAVTVDLAAGSGGEAGERDGLTAIESVQGGYGADTLLGDDGPNFLDGGSPQQYPAEPRLAPPPFGDRVDGRDGDDVLQNGTALGVAGLLVGGTGDDRLRPEGTSTAEGGPGNDAFGSSSYGATASGPFSCGSGVDSVAGSGRVVGTDCERFDLAGFKLSWPVRDGAGLRLTVTRPANERTCGAYVRLRDATAPAVLAQARVRLDRRLPRELTFAGPGLGAGDQVRVEVRPGVCPRGGSPMRAGRDAEWASTLLALPPAR